MVGIQEIQNAISSTKRFGPGLVGVFVGGTSGIGDGTARAFVRHAIRPRVYLVGRNRETAEKLAKEYMELNTEAKVEFVQSDVSLMKYVDIACNEIKAKEDRINLLFLSAGILSLKSRDETSEGLDKKFSLHYYSRIRFIQNLLPLLEKAASSTAPEGARPLAAVVSIFSGGLEGALNTSDLQLKDSYSVPNCARHATTMTTLQLKALAAKHPNITFMHTQPGGVQTNISQGLGKITATAVNVISFFLKPWLQSSAESGERHLYASTNDDWAKGFHIVGPNSTETEEKKILKELIDAGVDQVVCDHTTEVLEQIAETGKYP